jgi:adenosylmethionine-8-amino-7-oxononanoate aminotransferase
VTVSWIDRDAGVIWHGFTQMAHYANNEPVIVERAEGRELISVDGRRHLDAISSLWVTTLGHQVAELDEALIEQVGKIAHSTLLGNGNRIVVELAEALAQVVPVPEPHFLFASDGASAVEQALKLAYQYWVNETGRSRQLFLAFANAYHGDTIGALSLGGSGFGADMFSPLLFPVVRAPSFEDPRCMEIAAEIVRARGTDLIAVILEPLVQAAGGMRVGPRDDFSLLQEACDDTGVLLICDEVATGFGRTGTLFACEQCGLRPDILCLGKGLTGGYLPMSATVTNGKVYNAFLGEDLGARTFYHGHSYGGNALAAAVAKRHLEILHERDVLANVRARSLELAIQLDVRLAPLSAVTDVRTCGLMAAVELQPGPPEANRGRSVCAAAVRRGVLLRPLGDVVVIVPPLTVTASEIQLIVDVLEAAIREVTGA